VGPNLVAAVDIGGVGNTPLHDLIVGACKTAPRRTGIPPFDNTDV
jgi:hypothetical protein